MSIDEEKVPPATEEPAPEPVPEVPETTEPPTAEELADLRKKANAFEDQRKRAVKAEDELKKLKGQAQPELVPVPSAEAAKRLDRIELNSVGIKDREEQDYVLSAATRMGVSPSEAATDEIVSAKLEKMRETRKTKDATPAPSKGGVSTSNVTRLAEKALATGELPNDPALKAQVRAEMKRLTRR